MNQPLALVIEDDVDMAAILAFALEKAAYDTEIVWDGKGAIDRLAEINPAVVLLDLHLPLISGAQVLRYMRADERLAETKVLIVTADSQQAENLREQVNMVLLKPVSFEQLTLLATRLHQKKEPQNQVFKSKS